MPIQHIRGEPEKARVAHPLVQDGGPPVEFVIAKGRHVQVEEVPGFDHLAATEERGEERRRQRIAGQHEERARLLAPEAAYQRGHPGQAARPVGAGIEEIHIIDEKELHPRGGLVTARRAGAAGAEEKRQRH